MAGPVALLWVSSVFSSSYISVNNREPYSLAGTHPTLPIIDRSFSHRCPYRKSNPNIVMMESAKEWNGLDTTDGLYGAAERCIFIKREMGPDLIVIRKRGLGAALRMKP